MEPKKSKNTESKNLKGHSSSSVPKVDHKSSSSKPEKIERPIKSQKNRHSFVVAGNIFYFYCR